MAIHPSAIWQRLLSTFWFIPSLVTLGAIACAFAFIELDERSSDASDLAGFIYGGGPEGARAVLSALAGSMITVVSVTFSVTVVALTVASQHFGPRLLSNFMRDKAAQLVLGTFIGTFAYCLVVLRTVRGESDQISAFVPHLAVTGAMALALMSVAMLIYYVHHVSASMQVSEITSGVATDLERSIERLYPERIGTDLSAGRGAPPPPPDAIPIEAAASGYVQAVESDDLLALATDCGTVIWLDVRPGDFVTRGGQIARMHPPPSDVPSAGRRLNDAIVLGADRSAHQDAGFPVQQLVEVALHALSPGINEPFTAITCIDRLGQGLSLLARRHTPSALRADEEGRLRVVTTPLTFSDLLGDAFDPMRPYAAKDPTVARHVIDVLTRVARQATREEDLDAIRRQGRLMTDAAARELKGDDEIVGLRESAERLETVLRRG
jgi:uncharacterized membrane protein